MEDRTPSIEELSEARVNMKEAMRGDTQSPRTITVTLSPEEFRRIGGTEEDLDRLSKRIADFTNQYIMEM